MQLISKQQLIWYTVEGGAGLWTLISTAHEARARGHELISNYYSTRGHVLNSNYYSTRGDELNSNYYSTRGHELNSNYYSTRGHELKSNYYSTRGHEENSTQVGYCFLHGLVYCNNYSLVAVARPCHTCGGTALTFSWILSRMCILAPHQIDIVKGCGFCNSTIILIWYWFFYQLIMILEDENNIYLIFYFLHVFFQGIDNCFYAFGNTWNIPKFEPFLIENQPTQIR